MVEMIKRNKLLALVILVYIYLFIATPEKAFQSAKNSMYYVIEMIEIMPVIFVLTAIIEAWVPKKVIMNGFGEDAGVKGNIFSLMLGSFSAGPIYAAFPVCKMLLKKGASVGNVVIVLSAWAVIKVPMLANEAKFLGFQFMSMRWILTVVSIFMMAYIVTYIVGKEGIPISEEKDLVKISYIEINEQYCIGCGLCAKLAPDDFEIINKKARWKKTTFEYTDEKNLKFVIDKCPSKAIYFS